MISFICQQTLLIVTWHNCKLDIDAAVRLYHNASVREKSPEDRKYRVCHMPMFSAELYNVICTCRQGHLKIQNYSSAHCICSIGSALQTSAHFPQDAAAAEPTFTRSGCLLACNVSSSVDGAAYLPIIVPNFPRLLSFTCSNELHHKPASTVCHC